MAAMIFLTVLCLVVILVSGYRLRNKGKPYGMLLLTIHKLIPLGMLAYLILTLRQMSPLSPLAMTFAILGAVLYLLLIASGGWISAAKEAPGGVKIVHKVLPYLAIFATAATLTLVIINLV